jgi:hypothetical protein
LSRDLPYDWRSEGWRTPPRLHFSPARPSTFLSRRAAVVVAGLLCDGGVAAAEFAWRSIRVDCDEEDFTNLSQAGTVLDVDTSSDLSSVSIMVTYRWADQNPGGSVVSNKKPPTRR